MNAQADFTADSAVASAADPFADWILPFDAPRATEIFTSGGKGANLACAAQKKLPVPDGLILGNAAYRAFIAPLRPTIADILRRYPGDDTKCSQQLRALILQHALPAALPERLENALRALRMLASRVAVRSSGTLEDLPGAAFAGQHDTFLGLQGLPAILEAVRACYASLWNAHVLPYRARLGIDHLEAGMAVVIQEMVEVAATEAAGVAFSIDPVQGRLDQALINAAFGLGESVVAGDAPVDEYRMRRADGAPVSQTIAQKQAAIISTGQGTKTLPLPPEQQNAPTLTPAQCQEVTRLALAAEAHFGFPQDIEWAYRQGRLFLLQSRPVTRIPPRWTRDESAERFPNVVTPMTWDLVEEGFHTSLNYSFSLMGLPPFGDKWFAMRDFYIYGNQNAVELYSGRLPTQMSGDLSEIAAALPALAARYAWVQQLPVRWMRDLDIYLIGIGALLQESLEQKSLAELWAHVLRVRDLGREYFLPNIAISLTQRSLYALLQRLLQLLTQDADQAQALFDTLLATVDTKTAQVNHELWLLSRQIRADAALLTLARAKSGRALLPTLSRFPTFKADFERFLQRHGHRELDFDAYHPTWIEAPHCVLDQLKALIERPDDERPEQNRRRKIAAAHAEHALLAETPEALRYAVQEIIRLARVYTELDDLEHYQTTRLTLPFRRALRVLGRRLMAQDALAEADDIYFCPVAIFERALEDNDLPAIRAAAEANKAAYLRARQHAPDWVYGEAEAQAAAPDDGDCLQGLGGSPGACEGEVFVVKRPEDFASFPKNAILVARTTNPAWTPLFYQAIGVITESGGPLSHGAVTARELGLPAVMSIRNAAERLQNGMRVRVNGNAGTVTILGKGGGEQQDLF
jgi:pyruvate,water dikinase